MSRRIWVPGEVESGSVARDEETCKMIGTHLVRCYGGYEWKVRCSWEQGIADIILGSVEGDHGFTIHLRGEFSQAFSASALEKAARDAAGELLERFNLPRTNRNVDDRLANLLVDHKGNVMGDRSTH